MSSQYTSYLPYRPCVGLAIFNDKNQVLIGERLDNPGAWQLPQGGIDEGEELTKAAYREMLEEIGTDKAEIIEIAETKICYDFPPHLQERLFNGKYRGQEQTWIALRYTGADSDIDLYTHDPAEFKDWRWINLHEILDVIVPFKRDSYREIISLFEKHL